jgi:hypothetical protein
MVDSMISDDMLLLAIFSLNLAAVCGLQCPQQRKNKVRYSSTNEA